MIRFIWTVLGTVLLNNVVLTQFFSVESFLGTTRRFRDAVRFGCAVILVGLSSVTVLYIVNRYVIIPQSLTYLRTFFTVFVTCGMVLIADRMIFDHSVTLRRAIGNILPLLAVDGTVVGMTLTLLGEEYTYTECLMYTLGGTIGYLLVSTIFSSIRERIHEEDVVPGMRGFPLWMLTAGLLAVAFFGLRGLV